MKDRDLFFRLKTNSDASNLATWNPYHFSCSCWQPKFCFGTHDLLIKQIPICFPELDSDINLPSMCSKWSLLGIHTSWIRVMMDPHAAACAALSVVSISYLSFYSITSKTKQESKQDSFYPNFSVFGSLKTWVKSVLLWGGLIIVPSIWFFFQTAFLGEYTRV
jgi:hypothetical protein